MDAVQWGGVIILAGAFLGVAAVAWMEANDTIRRARNSLPAAHGPAAHVQTCTDEHCGFCVAWRISEARARLDTHAATYVWTQADDDAFRQILNQFGGGA
jgi:hypothetical protein